MKLAAQKRKNQIKRGNDEKSVDSTYKLHRKTRTPNMRKALKQYKKMREKWREREKTNR